MNHSNKGLIPNTRPLVSIGMPLYNNAATIEKAVRSLRRQTWTNIEIIISDDGSTDGTYEICHSLSQEDSRIKLFRQENNLYYQNFRFVLETSTADYFMWAAGDDYWRPRYIEANLQVLTKQLDVVGSVSRCIFLQSRRVLGLAEGTYPLVGTKESNIEEFLRNPQDNTRMYGLFRRDILVKSFPKSSFHAYDWALSAITLSYGKHYQVNSILMQRDKTPTEKYSISVDRDHAFFLFRYFPVLKMSFHLIFFSRVPINFGIIRSLIRMNLLKHQEYVKTVKPKYYAKFRRFYLYIERQLIERL